MFELRSESTVNLLLMMSSRMAQILELVVFYTSFEIVMKIPSTPSYLQMTSRQIFTITFSLTFFNLFPLVYSCILAKECILILILGKAEHK